MVFGQPRLLRSRNHRHLQKVAMPYDIHPKFRPLPVHGYLPMKSDDGLTLVQIFTDETGLITLVQVAQRTDEWGSWGPPTTVHRVD